MTLNDKVRLEVVIEQKDAALAEANKRIEILRVMIDDFSTQNRALREEISRLTAELRDEKNEGNALCNRIEDMHLENLKADHT